MRFATHTTDHTIVLHKKKESRTIVRYFLRICDGKAFYSSKQLSQNIAYFGYSTSRLLSYFKRPFNTMILAYTGSENLEVLN